MIILHGFIKKTQATPDEDVRLARKRLADWKESNP
jgi:phage-related protein